MGAKRKIEFIRKHIPDFKLPIKSYKNLTLAETTHAIMDGTITEIKRQIFEENRYLVREVE